MTKDLSSDDKGRARREELRTLIFAINDAFYNRVQGLNRSENRILRLLVGKKISMNPKMVPAHMLANRTPVRSFVLDIRMHQRNLLYFKSRRRSLEPELELHGLTLAELDAEWEKRVLAAIASQKKQNPSSDTQADGDETEDHPETAEPDLGTETALNQTDEQNIEEADDNPHPDEDPPGDADGLLAG